jgi:hypothetical protein
MSLRRTTKHFLILALSLVIGSVVFGAPRASAAVTLTPNPGPLPAVVRNYFVNADGLPFSPAFRAWLSRGGAPSVTSWTVPYGSPSIDLDFHWGGVVGYQPSSTTQSRLRIVSVQPSIGTPGGAILGIGAGNGFTLTFAPNQNSPGAFRQALRGFEYRPSGGFVDPTPGGRDYTLVVRYQAINQFDNGAYYQCIANGQAVNGFNYAACPESATALTVHITVPPAPVDAGSCSVSAPTAVYPGTSFSASFTANNTGDFNWPVNNGSPLRYRLRNPTPGGWAGLPLDVEILGPGVTPTGFGPILQPNRSTTWSRNFIAPPTLGRYTFDWRIYGSNNGSLGGLHFVGATCSQTVDVVERPYFRTYGGDVSVGGGQGASCRVDTNASIIGVTDTPHTAAGSQLANMALGLIMDTASAQLQTGPTTPNRLSFANASPQADGAYTNPAFYSAFGGGLNVSNVICAPDFWAGAPPGAPTSYTVNVPINLGMGQRQTVYVNGDAFINRNITYANGNYANVDQIPAFRLIVRGNIYVAPGVTELNGVFVAQPRAGGAANTTGRFYTCWPGHTPTPADINGVCRTRLTVYGAVVADLIKLTRSSGSAHTSSTLERYDGAGFGLGTAAERFIYTPEVWLTGDFDSGGGGDLNSFLTLPPVL